MSSNHDDDHDAKPDVDPNATFGEFDATSREEESSANLKSIQDGSNSTPELDPSELDLPKSDVNKTQVENTVEVPRPEKPVIDVERDPSDPADEAEDFSCLTEMSVPPDVSVPLDSTTASNSPDKKKSDLPDSDDDDFSNLTDITFAVRSAKIDARGIDATADLVSRAAGNKTARTNKTAKLHDATLAGAPEIIGVDEDDDFQLSQTKGSSSDLPSKIGRYEIKRLLGEGTFGKVFEARDPQLDRIVAVKVAKSMSGKTQIRRFLREARAAAQLRHPNIIPVYEYGQVQDENIIVYEFVAGETLKAYLKRIKIPPMEDTIRIVRQIADGLNYAHEQGIIHRDIKPENILVDPSGRPHIADFGCARSMEDNTNLTVDGSILGTPMYMSPEQASGKSNIADGRTDIWSLGVILYEMVSGQRPFNGQLSDLLFWICNKDPAPVRKVRSDAPLDIETICSKCLTRELDNRFASAGVLSDELERFERGEPIQSRRIGTLARTWMWAKRNQAIAGLMATVAITLLVGSIVSSAFAVKAYRAQKSRALAQMNALTTAEAVALPGIFESLIPFRDTVLPQLKEKLTLSDQGSTERHRLQMAIIELEEDQSAREQLADVMVEDLLVSDAGDFFVCRECLRFRRNELSEVLWNAAGDMTTTNSSGRRFRAAAALALYDPDSENWDAIAPDVAGYLTSINEIEMSHWIESVKPIREKIKPTLVQSFLKTISESSSTQQRAAAILSRLFVEDVPFLATLLPDATPNQIPYLSGALAINRTAAIAELQSMLDSNTIDNLNIDSHAIRKSNLVTTLIQLDDDYQWNQLGGGKDFSVATELIERLGPAMTPYERLSSQIQTWKTLDSNVLSGVLLALGQYQQNQILSTQRSLLHPVLMEIFSQHPDSRVHSSARWLLSQWGFQLDVESRERQLRREQPDPKLNWHVDMAGNTFALFGPVASTEIGMNHDARTFWSEKTRVAKSGFDAEEILNEPIHRKQIPRRFGICIHEVSVGQFQDFQSYLIRQYQERIEKVTAEIASLKETIASFDATEGEAAKDEAAKQLAGLTRELKRMTIRIKEPQRKLERRSELEQQLPVGDVDYFAALGYCRWLSEELKTECGLPSVEELQGFYERNTDILLTQENLNKLGYRLPTAAEWEFACRGGTETLFPFGQTPSAASKYAWYSANSDVKLHPIGLLKPGNTGLFDSLGNVSEWCLDWYRESLPKSETGNAQELYVDFGPEFQAKYQSLDREFRGGSFNNEIFDVRPTKRFATRPIQGFDRLGFRLARTYAGSE